MKKDFSEFTYHHVRLAPSKQVTSHSQPTWELSLVLKGSGYRIIGDTREHFKEGDLVLIPPGIKHCWYFDNNDTDKEGNIENITLMFEGNTLKTLVLSVPSIEPLFDRLLGLDTSLTFTKEVRMKLAILLIELEQIEFPLNIARFIEILLLIAKNLDSASTAGRNTGLNITEQRLKQIEAFVACNFSERLSLDDIAHHIGMNKSSLCCMFKRATGYTLLEYVTEKRLEHARYLLSTKGADESIASICYKAGFQSVSHFNHIFKRKFGYTPKQYIR